MCLCFTLVSGGSKELATSSSFIGLLSPRLLCEDLVSMSAVRTSYIGRVRANSMRELCVAQSEEQFSLVPEINGEILSLA